MTEKEKDLEQLRRIISKYTVYYEDYFKYPVDCAEIDDYGEIKLLYKEE